MSANGNSNGAPFKITLRDLPLPVRLVLSLFLIGVGAGYFSALVQLAFPERRTRATRPICRRRTRWWRFSPAWKAGRPQSRRRPGR